MKSVVGTRLFGAWVVACAALVSVGCDDAAGDSDAALTEDGGTADSGGPAPICCKGSDGAYAEAEREACINGGGAPVAGNLCDPVCCEVDGVPTSSTSGACFDEAGAEVDASRCEAAGQVCCRDADGNTGFVDQGSCEGEEVPEDQCAAASECCRTPDGFVSAGPENCAAAGGMTVAAEECEQPVCCDTEAGPAQTTAVMCANSDVLPDEQCEGGDEGCCETPQGLSLATAAACAGEGGMIVAAETCDAELCCSTEGGPALVSAISCTTADVLEPVECAPSKDVCCETDDGYETRQAGACDEAQVVPDALCAAPPEAVCCRTADGALTLETADDCEAAGGAPAEAPDACEAEVCCAADDGARRVGVTDCAIDDIRPPAECEASEVCCDFGDGEPGWTASDLCPEGGEQDPEACQPRPDPVCCRLQDGSLSVAPLDRCEASSGVAVPAAVCEAQVCCETADGPAEVSVLACDPRRVQPPEACSDRVVCCETGDGPARVPEAQCDAQLPDDRCEPAAEACCRFPDSSVAVVGADRCAEAEGEAVDPDVCAGTVCCEGPAGAREVSILACDPGAVRPPRACAEPDQVCCELDLGPETVDADVCPDDRLLPDDRCIPADEDACCRLRDGSLTLTPADRCEQGGGAPAPADVCEAEVCCDRGDVPATVSILACDPGAVLPGSACDPQPVCCETANGAERVPENECDAVLPEARCEALVCCETADGYQIIPANACPNGLAVDEALCAAGEDVCCRYPDGSVAVAEGARCERNGGAPAPDALCESEVCCAGPAGPETVSILTCDPARVLPAAECDPTPVCCETADGPAYVAGNACDAVLPAARCEEPPPPPVCCELPTGYETVPAAACPDGQAVADNLCDEVPPDVCCRYPDGSVAIAREDRCVATGGGAAPAAVCDSEVCCERPDGAATVSILLCAPAQVLPADACDRTPVCCESDAGPAYVPANACNAVLPEEACEAPPPPPVCCELPTGYETVPADACPDGLAVADNLCEAVPADVCCRYADGSVATAREDRCVGAGGGAAPAALCESEVCCARDDGPATVSILSCDPDRVLPAAACDETPVCCDTPEGVMYTPLNACGAVLPDDRCGDPPPPPVCCELATGYDVVPAEECPLGLSVPDDFCEPPPPDVCCRYDDGSVVVTREDRCAAAGGAEAPAAVCESEVCCALEDGVGTVSILSCDPDRVLPAAACDRTPVCCDTPAGPAYVASNECDTVLPAPACEEPPPPPVCCELPTGYEVVPAADCPAGLAVDGELCVEVPADVCCRYDDGSVAIAREDRCVAAGGAVAPGAVCESEVCCALEDGPGTVSILSCDPDRVLAAAACDRTPVCCDTPAGPAYLPSNECRAELPAEDCQEPPPPPVCCELPTGYEVVPADACPDGLAVDAALCEEVPPDVCCRYDDGSVAIAREDRCIASGGGVAPDAVCESEVCCALEDGPGTVSILSCDPARVLPAARCDRTPVCCETPAGPAYVASNECAAVLPEVACEEPPPPPVCCELPTGYEVVPADACPDGLAVDAALCEEVPPDVCCRYDDGSVAVAREDRCVAGGGAIAPDPVCESEVCCALEEGAGTVSILSCDPARVLPAAACDRTPVCCDRPSGPMYAPANECDAVLPEEACQEPPPPPVCCELPTGYEVVAAEDCPDGLAVDGELCEEVPPDVCCRYDDGSVAIARQDRCVAGGGAVAPDAVCESEVCCALEDGAGTVSILSCDPARILPADACDTTPVCCDTPQGPDYVPNNACRAELPAEDCQDPPPPPVCCELPGGYQEVPADACPDGLVVPDNLCVEVPPDVCCRFDDGSVAIAREDRCLVGGSAVAPDAVCESEVCCALEDGPDTVSILSCDPARVLRAARCDRTPVCCETPAGPAYVASNECAAVLAPEACEEPPPPPVCCEFPDLGYQTVPADACPDGLAVPAENCEEVPPDVCCRYDDGSVAVAREDRCVAGGGAIAPAAVCESEVCCALEDGPGTVSILSCDPDRVLAAAACDRTPVCCDTPAGPAYLPSNECRAELPAEDCQEPPPPPVCCELPTGYEVVPADACPDGLAVDAALCEEVPPDVCCRFDDGSVAIAREDRCVAGGGAVAPDAVCESEVCCALEDGAATVSILSCEPARVRPAAECDRTPVCCETAAGPAYVASNECDAVLAPEACDEPPPPPVCCELPGGYAEVPADECPDGLVVGGDLCEEVPPDVCCRYADGSVAIAREDRCFAGGGAAAPDAVCESEVCCALDDGPGQVSILSCDPGRVLPAAECDRTPVCCETPNGPGYVASNECDAVLPERDCDEPPPPPVCCEFPDIGYQTVPADACPDGLAVPAQNCEEVPPDVCCRFEDGSVAIAREDRCVAGGGAVTPDAVCESEVCCALDDGPGTVSILSCDPARVLPAARCDRTPVCCDTADGPAYVASNECDAVLAPERCEEPPPEPVCCEFPDRGYQTVPADACPDGLSVPANLCEEVPPDVCCRYDDGAVAIAREDRCVAGGGAVAPAAVCESEVCCNLEDGPGTVSILSCDPARVLPAAECDRTPVCCETPAGPAYVASNECDAVLAPEACNEPPPPPVCCELPTGFETVPADACPDGLTVADDLCDEVPPDVCCRYDDGSVAIARQDRCVAAGGATQPDAVCEAEVCCDRADGPQNVSILACDPAEVLPADRCDRTPTCCDVPGGPDYVPANECFAPLPDEDCEAPPPPPVCCELPTGYEVVPAADCPDGLDVPGEFCEEVPPDVCCQFQDGTVTVIREDRCVAGGGAAQADEVCEAEVCCEGPDGARTVSVLACDPAQVLPDDRCDVTPVCCDTPGGAVYVPRNACDAVLDPARCDEPPPEVCCEFPDLGYQTVPADQCPEGLAVPEDNCEGAPPAVCCRYDDGSVALAREDRCESAGGAVAPDAVCESEVCCNLPDGPGPESILSCEPEDVLPAAACDRTPVCCETPGGPAYLPSNACGVALPPEDCAEPPPPPVCCEFPDRGYQTVPAAECPDGLDVPAVNCEEIPPDVCCRYDDGTVSVVREDRCVDGGGAVAADEVCESEVCCDRPDGPAPVSILACDPARVLPAAECDRSPVCCETPEGPAYVPANECASLLPGSACQGPPPPPVCCELPGGYEVVPDGECPDGLSVDDGFCEAVPQDACCRYEDGSVAIAREDRCVAAGGAVAPAAVCESEVCCDRADGPEPVSILACEPARVLPAEACDRSPVCCETPAGPAFVPSNECENELEGTACGGPPPPPVCCELPDGAGYEIREAAECPDDLEVPGNLCADIPPDVCCRYEDGSVAVAPADRCAAGGGAATADAVCESQICCDLADGPQEVSILTCDPARFLPVEACDRTPVCCETPEGPAYVPVNLCDAELPGTACGPPPEPVCCELPSGLDEVPEDDCPEALVVDDALCAVLPPEVCCRFGDGSLSIARRDRCEEGGGAVSPDAVCAADVCCDRAGGPQEVNILACEPARVLPGSACDRTPVCCETPEGAAFVPANECAAELPVTACGQPPAPVCCELDDGYASVPEAECPGGQAVAEGFCEDIPVDVCCRYPDGGLVVTPEDRCAADGGEAAPDAVCQSEVCCALENGPAAVSILACDPGRVLPAASCDRTPVCCGGGGVPFYAPRNECGEELPPGDCVDEPPPPVCCELPTGYEPVPLGECPAGQEVADALCEGVPVDACCRYGDGTVAIAREDRCVVGGGVVAPAEVCEGEVCCERDGGAQLVSILACDAAAVLPAGACDVTPVCCQTPAGAVYQPSNECPSVLPDGDCVDPPPAPVCCELPDGYQLVPDDQCPDGLEVGGFLCDGAPPEVCCRYEDGAVAIAREDRCVAAGGAVTAAGVCQSEVCCGRADGAGFVSILACDPAQVLPNAECDATPVCCETPAGAAFVPSNQCERQLAVDACNGPPPADVCCELNDGYALLPGAECPDAQEVAVAFCDGLIGDVCCRFGDGAIAVARQDRCAAGGGAAVDDAVCESAVCCGLPEGPVEVSILACDPGAVRPASDCDVSPVCCDTPDGAAYVPSNECPVALDPGQCGAPPVEVCCDQPGGPIRLLEAFCPPERIVADAVCDAIPEDVCCEAGDGALSIIREDRCEAAGGAAVDGERCQAQVCCNYEAGPAYVLALLCSPDLVFPNDVCDAVAFECCNLPGGPEFVARGTCEDGILPPDQCEPIPDDVCCDLPDGVRTVPADQCPDGSEVDALLCQPAEDVCCRYEDGSVADSNAGDCAASGGAAEEQAVCDQSLCCEQPEGIARVPVAMCIGAVVDFSLCDAAPLCCDTADGPALVRADECTVRRPAQDCADLEPICCDLPEGLSLVRPAVCPDGSEVDLQLCAPDDVCCDLPDGPGRVPRDQCDAELPDDRCIAADVCCETPDGPARVPADLCVVALPDDDCGAIDVCCESADGPVLVPEDLCVVPLPADECLVQGQVCCDTPGGFVTVPIDQCPVEDVADEARCDGVIVDVCCDLPDGPALTPADQCNLVLPADQCAAPDICCRAADGSASYQPEADCTGAGGAVEVDGYCTAPVCCEGVAGPALTPRAECAVELAAAMCGGGGGDVCCSTPDGPRVVDAANCEAIDVLDDAVCDAQEICCESPFGDLSIARRDACLAAGSEEADSAICEAEVCCSNGGVAELVRAVDCAGQDLLDPDACEGAGGAPVCCDLPGGRGVVDSNNCPPGSDLQADQCGAAEVCCDYPGIGVITIPSAQCIAGSLVDPAQCQGGGDDVCCASFAGASVAQDAQCLAPAVSQPLSLCATRVCCNGFVTAIANCLTPLPADQCGAGDTVCCTHPLFPVPVNVFPEDCPGQVVDDALCRIQ